MKHRLQTAALLVVMAVTLALSHRAAEAVRQGLELCARSVIPALFPFLVLSGVLTSIGAESGEIPYTAYFAAESYMTEHQDVVQKFTNAIAKGQKWVQEHTDLEVAQAIADQFPDTDVAVLEKVAARYRGIGAWKTDPSMEEADFSRLMDVMEEAGELEARVDFEKLVTNQFTK